MGWWVNDLRNDLERQDQAIAQNATAIENEEIAREIEADDLRERATNEKLETRDAINQIKTQQALDSQVLEQIAKSLEELKRRP